MKKKIKVAYLLDKSNNWLEKYLKISDLLTKSKIYRSKIFKDYRTLYGYDIVFILGYSKILKDSFLNKNKLNLVVHESELPQGKGFAPVSWQILENKNKISVCLFKATDKVDSGSIYFKGKINFNGTELYDEIRFKQAEATIKIAFEEYRIFRVWVDIPEYNESAVKMFSHLNFTHEGTLRKSRPHHGARHNSVIMGILVDEFRSRK